MNIKNLSFNKALSFSVFFLILLFGFMFAPIESDIKLIGIDIVSPVIGIIASIALFEAARVSRESSPTMSKAWYFLGFSQVAYFLGDLTWGILEIGFGEVPFPSIADIPYFAYYPIFLFAVFQFPKKNRKSFTWILWVMDLTIFSLGGLLLMWNFLLGPTIQSQTDVSLFMQILAVAYPAGDLILFVAIIVLMFNRIDENNSLPLLLIALGVSIMIITDSIFSIQNMNGTYIQGGPLDIAYTVQNLFVFLAAISQCDSIKIDSVIKVYRANIEGTIINWFSIFSFFWLLAAILLLLHSHNQPLPMDFHQIGWVTLGLLLLLIVRLFLSNRQIRHLVSEIEHAQKKISRQTRKLHHDSLHDILTGLPNRMLFMDVLDRVLDIKKNNEDFSFAVMFLDLDEFKKVNDSKGHTVGDSLLIEVANRLNSSTRDTDLIARLGGDEFLILLEDIKDTESVLLTANRILDALEKPFEVSGERLFTSTSIGIVFVWKESDYRKSTDILRDADIAMYHAKNTGKSRFAVFDSKMRMKTIQKKNIENDLRQAFESDQFFLVYQPIFSLNSGRVIGFEAFIRWRNQNGEIVMPDDFIPIAEETGIIIDLGDWVIREACTQLRDWKNRFSASFPVSIHVNVSVVQFSQADFVQKLLHKLGANGIKQNELKLEISESTLLNFHQRETILLPELKKAGIHLEIDDFGTGFSSLKFLQKIPVDTLKIDRFFIQDIDKSEKKMELIRAMVNMAKGMKLHTTAEGIESQEQLRLLTSIGCNNGQGSYWSRPVLPNEVERFFENNPKPTNRNRSSLS